MPSEIIKLVSTADTGYYYTTTKNKKNTPEKMEIKKFDPKAIHPKTGKQGAHVPFKEKKAS